MPKMPFSAEVILFTSTYPFGHGEAFLEAEVPILAEKFSVTIVPVTDASGPARATPENVRVDTTLCSNRFETTKFIKYFLGAIRSFGLVVREIKRIPLNRHFFNRLRQMLSRLWRSQPILDYVSSHQAENDVQQVVFYSYWLTQAALGIARHKNSGTNPHAVYIARAHRFDLYKDEMPYFYQPFTDSLITGLDFVFPVSHDGKKELISKFEWPASKVIVSYLGVSPSPPTSTTRPKAKLYRFVSCSYIVPVKRVPLIFETLSLIASKLPKFRFEWHHIGSGPLEAALKEKIKTNPLDNFTPILHGQLSNMAIREFYSRNYFDAFINLSSSEGLPVSIMEALASGIPVIATNVGGTSEALSEGVGILVSKDITSDELASIIIEELLADKNWGSLRARSLQRYQQRFNAENNFHGFSDFLFHAIHEGV